MFEGAALEPIRYGTWLFEALFPKSDDLRDGYREGLALARHRGQRLRFRLHLPLEDSPDLHLLRWELLYDPEENLFLSRSQELAFSRYLGSSFDPGTVRLERPRLLVALACPTDLAEYGFPPIDQTTTRETLENTLASFGDRIDYEFLEGPVTVQRLRDRLVSGAFHVLCLQAHGLIPRGRRNARLVLENEDRQAAVVAEHPFSEAFDGQRHLRLVQLVVCTKGRTKPFDPFAGLGAALVRRNLPPVVTMQRQGTPPTAARFTEHLVHNLLQHGQVDAAVNDSRRELFEAAPESSDWETPTLFMCLRSGELWELRNAEAASSPEKRLRALVASRCQLPPLAEARRRHDRRMRDLLRAHGGREIETGESSLALFERPARALRFAMDYHRILADWSRTEEIPWVASIGLHLGEVFLHENTPRDIENGARPFDVDGPARDMAFRLVRLASDGQTLLTRTAFDVARQGSVPSGSDDTELLWLAHGAYTFRNLGEPAEVFEVGVEGSAPLEAPPAYEEARPAAGHDTIPGWRPAPGLAPPQRPHWVMSRELGKGGFGEVWLAVHGKTHEQRVFKFCFESSRLRALQREITLFRLLKEELGNRGDIARILDWDFAEAPYFIESEYASGGNLVEWARDQGGIAEVSLEQRLEIVAQAATALAAAHSVGVLHKDVKPTNLLIERAANEAPTVRLCDFGIGLVTERERLAAAGITALGMTVETDEESSVLRGTHLYMAPELFEGKPATLQADIYALGVLLYQMVIGDLSKALAPGWQRDVSDELLREDIAVAVDGAPERRLMNALHIAEHLRTLQARRWKREIEQYELEQMQKTREFAERKKKRRRIAVLVAVFSVLIGGGLTYQEHLFSKAKSRARDSNERLSQSAGSTKRSLATNKAIVWSGEPNLAQGHEIPSELSLAFLVERDERARKRIVEKSPGELASLGMQAMGFFLHWGGRDLQVQAMNLVRWGHYEMATAKAEELVRVRQEIAEATHLFETVNSYEEIAKSRPLLQEEVRNSVRLGTAAYTIRSDLTQLATLYLRQGRTESAEKEYKASMRILEERHGNNSRSNVPNLNGLGIAYLHQGRNEEAEAVLLRALDILEKDTHREGVVLATVLRNLALTYRTQGRLVDAELLFRRAVGTLEEMSSGSSRLATELINLGLTVRSLGRYDEAEKHFRRALQIREKNYDLDHPGIAEGLSTLASAMRLQGRLLEAEDHYQRALGVWEKSQESERELMATAQLQLAEIRRAQRENRAARAASLRDPMISEELIAGSLSSRGTDAESRP